jgi:hypothetical protein
MFFMQLPQNIAVEPGIQTLTCWDWCCALRYHNCCTDGSTSPEYFGYHLVAPGQGYCTPQWVLVNNYKATVE